MSNISVIIPIFNTKSYLLKRCFESVLLNASFVKEVLLVDSSDDKKTKETIEEYVSSNSLFRLINTEKGVSHQRNIGIDNACGDYIAFIDSDDYISEGYFKFMMDLVKEHNCDVVYPQLEKEIIDHEFNVLSKKRLVIEECQSYIDDNSFFINTPKNGLVNPVKLYKRDLIGDLRFREDIAHGEDMIFNYELSKKGIRPCFCKLSLYTFTGYIDENAARKRINTNFIIILKEMLKIYKDKKRVSVKENVDGILYQYNSLFSLYFYECVRVNKIKSLLRLIRFRIFYLYHNFSLRNFFYVVFPLIRKLIKGIFKK